MPLLLLLLVVMAAAAVVVLLMVVMVVVPSSSSSALLLLSLGVNSNETNSLRPEKVSGCGWHRCSQNGISRHEAQDRAQSWSGLFSSK